MKGKRHLFMIAGFVLLFCMSLVPGSVLAAGERSIEEDTGARGLAEGRYAVDVQLSGGSGKVQVESPAVMTVENGKYFVRIVWSSPDYQQMRVGENTYENQSQEGGNSSFWIPVLAFDEEIPILATTLVLGPPHQIPYQLRFYADSIGPEDTLAQEGAKRVLMMAAGIIGIGGILNYFSKKKRRQDYLGKKR